MPSLFTRIVDGEIPAHRVYEDDEHLAFLDINPIQRGHTLVIPKQEVAQLFDLEPEAYTRLWQVVRRVEKALRAATGCARVVVLVVGYEVPHAHVHLIPTNELGEFPLPPQGTLSADSAEQLKADITAQL